MNTFPLIQLLNYPKENSTLFYSFVIIQTKILFQQKFHIWDQKVVFLEI